MLFHDVFEGKLKIAQRAKLFPIDIRESLLATILVLGLFQRHFLTGALPHRELLVYFSI